MVPHTRSLQPAFALAPNPQAPNETNWKGWPSEDQQCDEQGNCWPRLFIIGTQKGASSSLFNVLHEEGIACGTMMNDAVHQALPTAAAAKAQPARVAEGGLMKEAHMLDLSKPDWQTLLKQPELYRSLYRVRDCPQRTFLDATPKYSRHPGAPGRLLELMPASWVPQLRVVLSIREPVARDLSWFNHKCAQLNQNRASMVDQFCSVSGDGGVDDYPTYEGEVRCRKQELDSCMSGARLRLNLNNMSEVVPHNKSKGDNSTSLLEDYSECVEGIWHNNLSRSDPDNSASWDDQSSSPWETPPGVKPGGDSVLLAWGMYLPQIQAWSRHLSRTQILVLDFDQLVTQPEDMLPRVTSFMGLPGLRNNKMPHENGLPYARKVDVISCETSRFMYGTFREANDQLVRAMREDHERGHAPSQEPLFLGFSTTVPCEEQEHVWLEGQEHE